MTEFIASVQLDKAYRLINHGPTVLVSSQYMGISNVMAAAWACPLDYDPSKLTIVLDRATKTRELVEQSGSFVIQVPNIAQLHMTRQLGSHSLFNEPDKLSKAGVELFTMDGFDLPFVAGCSAWLACKVTEEPSMQEKYDLFIGEVIGAWSDIRIFKNGHWHFEMADPKWRSLHHVSGGYFYAIGEAISDSPLGD